MRLASVAIREPLRGSSGFGPMPGARSYQTLPVGLPMKSPGTRCLSEQVPFQGPWLSV